MARILIMDDDALLRKAITMALVAEGHSITAASNGRDGIAALGAQGADLVLTDLEMPHGELAIVSTLRAEFPRLPVIVISGRIEWLDSAASLGAVGVLSKPFTLEQLTETVANAVAAIGLPGSR